MDLKKNLDCWDVSTSKLATTVIDCHNPAAKKQLAAELKQEVLPITKKKVFCQHRM